MNPQKSSFFTLFGTKLASHLPDGRYFRQFNQKKNFAFRLNIGFAIPFGFSKDVPYVKQFYVGGPNSIRGWAARGLGPGGYKDPLTTSNRNRLLFYQTGDFKMEASAEYRFDLFWRLKGAFFLDAGNIWTLQNDPSRCGSQFVFTSKEETCGNTTYTLDPFYKQIALGSGGVFGVGLGKSMQKLFYLPIP